MSKEIIKVAGMSLNGGRKENFFLSLLEYFPDKKRWSLSALEQVKDEESFDRDEIILNWLDKHHLSKVFVDFPLSEPPSPICDSGKLDLESAKNPRVIAVREKIKYFLNEDLKMNEEDPKEYERKRLKDDEINYSENILNKETWKPILSKAFKRKLKKPFLPYWNRPLDVWIWAHYYDQMLKTFNITFDSFGNVSDILLRRFKYLSPLLPKGLDFYQSDIYIILLELYRADIIQKRDLDLLQDIEKSAFARKGIVTAIEKSFNLFLYDNDLELMAKNPKAFNSFLLAITGLRFIENKIIKISDWAYHEEDSFVVPHFLLG